MIRRHVSAPHTIACVTDIPEGIDSSVEIIAPPRDFEDWRIPSWGPERPQCLRRLAMYAPDAGKIFGDRFVCMDLDCVVVGQLDPMIEARSGFRIAKGRGGVNRPYNGSMVYLEAGARPQVYERLTQLAAAEAGKQFVGSDQAWLAYCLGVDEETWGPEDGLQFWDKADESARVVFFPGKEKPWDWGPQGRDWVRDNYRAAT